MNFEEGFFDKMRFPIHELKLDVDLVEKFPLLKQFPEFRIETMTVSTYEGDVIFKDPNQLIRYVLYCYDLNIAWDVPDFESRKKESAKLVGILKGKQLDLMINNEISFLNDMIIAFFRIQNNRKYRWKIMGMDLLDQYQRIIMEPISGLLDDDKRLRAAELKSKLMKESKSIGEEIDVINKEFLGSEEEAGEIFEKSTKGISPQNLQELK